MTFPACGGPSWLPPILLSLFLSAQLSTTCLAQSNTASGGNSLAPITSTTVVTVIQSSSASLAAAQTHTIQVGLADHIFKPDSTVANIGDVSTCIVLSSLLHEALLTDPDYRIRLLPTKPQRRPRRIRLPLYPVRDDGPQQGWLLLGFPGSQHRPHLTTHLPHPHQ